MNQLQQPQRLTSWRIYRYVKVNNVFFFNYSLKFLAESDCWEPDLVYEIILFQQSLCSIVLTHEEIFVRWNHKFQLVNISNIRQYVVLRIKISTSLINLWKIDYFTNKTYWLKTNRLKTNRLCCKVFAAHYCLDVAWSRFSLISKPLLVNAAIYRKVIGQTQTVQREA